MWPLKSVGDDWNYEFLLITNDVKQSLVKEMHSGDNPMDAKIGVLWRRSHKENPFCIITLDAIIKPSILLDTENKLNHFRFKSFTMELRVDSFDGFVGGLEPFEEVNVPVKFTTLDNRSLDGTVKGKVLRYSSKGEPCLRVYLPEDTTLYFNSKMNLCGWDPPKKPPYYRL